MAADLESALNVQNRAGHDRRCARRTAENLSVSLADVAGVEGVAIAGRGNLLSPALHIDARTVAREAEARMIRRRSGADDDCIRIANLSVELAVAVRIVEVDIAIACGLNDGDSECTGDGKRVEHRLVPFERPIGSKGQDRPVVANRGLQLDDDHLATAEAPRGKADCAGGAKAVFDGVGWCHPGLRAGGDTGYAIVVPLPVNHTENRGAVIDVDVGKGIGGCIAAGEHSSGRYFKILMIKLPAIFDIDELAAASSDARIDSRAERTDAAGAEVLVPL